MARHISAGSWISINKQLPEKDEWCLLFVYRGTWLAGNKGSVPTDYGVHCTSIGSFNGKDSWSEFGPDNYSINEVTHWMPCPEPPKQEIDRSVIFDVLI